MGNSTKERPILFSGAMVRAILDGRKMQTRRVVKPKPFDTADLISMDSEDREIPKVQLFVENGTLRRNRLFGSSVEPCPYGIPGDRLWVKETWWQIPEPTLSDLRDGADTWPEPIGPQEQRIAYAADGDDADVVRRWGWKLRPSIFMFRWASRITLEITDVRVQRLQDISEEDAQAEGVEPIPHSEGPNFFSHCNPFGWHNSPTAKGCFSDLWDSINGKTHPWASNPWLWCLTFKRVTQ